LKSLRGREQSKDVGVDMSIILKRMLGKWDWNVWIGFTWLRIGTGGGFLQAR
jgi:hypothetical protein